MLYNNYWRQQCLRRILVIKENKHFVIEEMCVNCKRILYNIPNGFVHQRRSCFRMKAFVARSQCPVNIKINTRLEVVACQNICLQTAIKSVVYVQTRVTIVSSQREARVSYAMTS